MKNDRLSNFSSKSVLRGGCILFLILILILGSNSNSSAAPPLPTVSDLVEGQLPPQGEVVFETVTLPPEAQFAPVNLATSQQITKHPKLDSALLDLVAATKVSDTAAVNLAKARSLRLSGNRVHIQIVTHAAGLKNAVEAVNSVGGEVTGVSNDNTLLQGWLTLNSLETVAAQADVYFIRQPAEATLLEPLQVGNSTTEAIDDMNATAWHNNGYTGTGVKIAIIDGGFTGYTSLLSTDLPTSVTVRNFVDGETDGQVGSTSTHGTACAEIVHDVAPGAQLYLVKINTNLDLQEAVNYAIGQGVDIISTSLGWYNLTPGDGSGFFADLVTQARNAGILWATAASNDREAHWGGLYSDSDNDNFHQFSGTQEVNYFGPGDGSAYAIPAGYLIRVFLRWNDWIAPVDQDYDLYLYRWNGSSWVQIASSTNFQNGGAGQQPTEYAAAVSSGAAAPYGFAVMRYNSTQTVNFEIFAPKIARLDKLLNARSLSNLADAPNALTVAALDVDSPYPQESYSSEGPTNGSGGSATGGSIKPDISAYANVSTQSYGSGIFNGTSAATPHVAGAAALGLDANPTFTPTQLRTFLESNAIDMGAVGKDTRFGFGRLYLGIAPPPAPPNTNYVYLPLLTKSCGGESNNIADAIAVSSGQNACGQVNSSTDQDDVYKIFILNGQTLTISMTGSGGDADLYLYFPSATNVNTDIPADYSVNIGNNEFIQGTVTGTPAFWYIDVYAYSGATQYNLTATLSGPSSAEVKTFSFTGTAKNHTGLPGKITENK